MKLKEYKILVFFIILIFIVYIIYHLFFNKENKIKEYNNYEKEEKIIINQIDIGVIDFDNMNPIVSNNRNVQEISKLIFEPLMALTEDSNLEGCIAKEWTRMDKDKYLIKINNNIQWHDGVKLDADDIIYTVNKIKELKDKSIYYNNINNIKKIDKIDDYTLKIKLKKEDDSFEDNLTFPIMSKENEDDNSKYKIIGTGMYYISEINNNSIILKENTDWCKRNNKELKLDTINLKLYPELNNVIEDFKNGNIDLFTTSNTNIEKYLSNIEYHKLKITNSISLIYSKNIRGKVNPTSYNLFYNIENWYKEY